MSQRLRSLRPHLLPFLAFSTSLVPIAPPFFTLVSSARRLLSALVRRLLADKNSVLVPRKGGFGAFGMGTDVVKARNRGEAREAGRHVSEFRDQKRREDFKTKVGLIGNHQKHFRDPRKCC